MLKTNFRKWSDPDLSQQILIGSGNGDPAGLFLGESTSRPDQVLGLDTGDMEQRESLMRDTLHPGNQQPQPVTGFP